MKNRRFRFCKVSCVLPPSQLSSLSNKLDNLSSFVGSSCKSLDSSIDSFRDLYKSDFDFLFNTISCLRRDIFRVLIWLSVSVTATAVLLILNLL